MTVYLYVILGSCLLLIISIIFYNPFFKRFYDIVFSLLGIIFLLPVFLVLTVLGAVKMKGNPFFTQLRPGKKDKNGKEKIFKLIKFRSMTCEKGKDGQLLPDKDRLTAYGRKLRSTSLDELPELFNVLKGDMSIVGPRPLLVQYLPRYNPEQRKRHLMRPGITGYAQINGRNAITWNEKFKMDVWYVDHVSLINDLKIIIHTFSAVILHKGINSESGETMSEFLD